MPAGGRGFGSGRYPVIMDERHAAAVPGFLVVASLWGLYFDRIDDGTIRGVLRGFIWNYPHLPLLAGLVPAALGIEYTVREAATGWS